MKTFYLHIPKTGGQTLAARLASAFPSGAADILGRDFVGEEGLAQLRDSLTRHDFVERHVGGGLLETFNDADILCTVRHPVLHRVSDYLHVLRGKGNILHAAANRLSPEDFFAQFGDLLTNQSRYLVGAFSSQHIDLLPHRHTVRNLYACVDRIRWLVPTEHIDEFSALWALETGNQIPFASHSRNIAPRHASYDQLVKIVESMPHLYACDLLLWQIAKEHFEKYRQDVLERLQPFNHPMNAGTAYTSDDGSGIWLRDGWHPPQLDTPVGTAWWAGPSKFSRVHVKRKPLERYLQTSIVVVCGVPHHSIVALTKDCQSFLPQSCVPVSSDRWVLTIDLATLGEIDEFYLAVPAVCAPIMFSEGSTDTERKSFATCDWRLTGQVDQPEALAPNR